MERIPEPELMLDEGQVRAYAEADFAEPHDHFIALLRERLPDLPATGLALDLGCGAGDISRRFAAAFPGWRVLGIDGSPTMLTFARAMTNAAGLADRVRFDEVLLPAHPPDNQRYGLVFSNSLLHHITDPVVFWSAVRNWVADAGQIFVMDLLRPADRDIARALVQQHSGDEPEVLQTDFFNSLLAAFREPEIAEQLRRARLAQLSVEVVSDRHVIAWGGNSAGRP
ncbi:MAG: class I SAM-dependent methyltransferase [Gammaproteobacteria bacterium]